MERTLVFMKPDAVARGFVGEIIARFERKGFLIAGLKMMQLSEERVRAHYAAHEGKDFYEPLVQYVISGPVVAVVLEGRNAVAVVRDMMGRTFGSDSPAGTIRGDFALSNRFNLVHGSDSPEAAEQEICAFFGPGELVEYPQQATRWVYDWCGAEPV
jgi:nucleoside-diphosphate kinase